MTTGDIVAVQSGIISGAGIITWLNTQNLGAANASGAGLFAVPIGNGQVQVIKYSVTGW